MEIGCGYLLKPLYMRNEDNFSKPQNKIKKLIVEVLSARQLPKVKGQSTKGEVIDPYVILKICGYKCDEQEFKTRVINIHIIFFIKKHYFL